MSDHFAEATVNISPSLTGFVKDLEDDLKEKMKKVKPPTIRVKAGLERGFVGSLRTQVNDAITRVQGQIKPIRVRVLIEAPSRRALSEIVKGAPVSLPGAIAPGGTRSAEVVAQADNERLLNSLHAQGAHDFSLLAAAEDKHTKVRDKGTAASKKLATQEQKTARSNELVADVRKRTNLLDITAATRTGELAQAKAALAEATKLASLADEARALNVTKETVALQGAAQAERQLRFERVQSLEAAAAAGGGAGAGAQAGLAKSVQRARATGFAGLSSAVTGLREADAAFARAGQSAKDLAVQEAILVKRSEALKVAKTAVAQATKAESDTLRVATTATLQKAEADKLASQTAVQAIRDQIALEKKQASASASLSRQRAAAAASAASSEKRRAEQLSRGGQASILSLAGIRGATLAASRSFLVGAAAITVFARAVKQFADLERNLDVFRATTSATANQMEQVRKEATALGADLTLPSVAAGDAAGAMVELAKAGLSVQDSIDGARGVLSLATAAAIDTADAVRLVANVLNAFSLSGRDAITVADTLANAANLAQGSIADIGTAFQQAASAGHQVGLDFQDTATFLTILAKNGLRGSDAGTSLRTALIRLVNPSKKAAEQFEKLGITLRDSAGNLRPDVFLQIANATAALTPAARDATIALIGGQDAFRAVTILGRQSVGAFLAMRAALRETGTAAELAKARTDGLHGAMDGLQSVLETIGTTTAGHVGPALADFVRTVSSGLTAFSENQQVAETLNQTLAATAQGFNVLGQAISGVATVALPLASLLSQVATSIGINTILAGVVAYKSLNAVLDGSILRLRILRPLFGAIAAARIGSAISSGAAAIGQAAVQSAKLGPQTATAGIGLRRLLDSLSLVAPKVSVLRTVTSAIGPAMLAAATGTGIWVAALAAAAGLIFINLTRASELEKATSSLQKATDALAESYSRVKTAAQEVASTERTLQQQRTGITQAVLNHARALRELQDSDAPRGSVERKQLILNELTTRQDVTFAIQDQNKALKDLKTTQEEQATAIDENVNRIKEQKTAIVDLIGAAVAESRSVDFLSDEQKARFGLAKAVEALGKVSKKNLASGDAELSSLGRRQAALKGFLQAAQEFGRKGVLKPIVLDILLKAPDTAAAIKEIVAKMKFGSEQARREFIKGIIDLSGLGPAMRRALEDQLLPSTQQAVHTVADWARHKGGREIGEALGEGANEGFKATFDISDIVATAQAQGLSTLQTLARVQAEQVKAQARFNRINKATQGGTVFKSQDQQDAFEKARDELNAANEEIKSLNGDIKSASDDAAQAITDAQKDRDTAAQRIVDAVTEGRRATLLQRKITNAGLTEWLGDDLKTTQAWLNYLRNLAKTLPERLRAAGASKAIITAAAKAISNLIFDTTQAIKKTTEDIKKNTKARHDAAQALLMERFDLRISIAQSREDVAAEIRARTAKLKEITRELVRMRKQYGINSIQWLRVKDAQVAEIAAINELKKKNNDKNNSLISLQKQEFEFLQKIQGFTGNLLGNLIPGGIGGLVGGTVGAPPGPAGPVGGFGQPGGPQPGGGVIPGFGAVAGAAVAKKFQDAKTASDVARDRGFTSGQGNTTNMLLRKILAELHKQNRGAEHPEAKTQRKTASGTYDYSPTGPGM